MTTPDSVTPAAAPAPAAPAPVAAPPPAPNPPRRQHRAVEVAAEAVATQAAADAAVATATRANARAVDEEEDDQSPEPTLLQRALVPVLLLFILINMVGFGFMWINRSKVDVVKTPPLAVAPAPPVVDIPLEIAKALAPMQKQFDEQKQLQDEFNAAALRVRETEIETQRAEAQKLRKQLEEAEAAAKAKAEAELTASKLKTEIDDGAATAAVLTNKIRKGSTEHFEDKPKVYVEKFTENLTTPKGTVSCRPVKAGTGGACLVDSFTEPPLKGAEKLAVVTSTGVREIWVVD